jgi:hypothetical protein
VGTDHAPDRLPLLGYDLDFRDSILAGNAFPVERQDLFEERAGLLTIRDR